MDRSPAGGEIFEIWTEPGSPEALTAFTVAATKIKSDGGNNQQAPPGSTLTLPVSVRFLDTQVNPVSGRMVSFRFLSVPSSATGQSLTATQATSGSDGIAETQVKLDNKPGMYTIRAVSSGLSGIIDFTATAVTPLQPPNIQESG
ncbi:MAG: Ig-like domain-containing protein [Bacillota bacterium]